MSNETFIRRLEALAAGFCQDAGVGLEVHARGWGWDQVRQVVLVGAADLALLGPDWCAGVLAHEVGHLFISRDHLFAPVFPSPAALQALMSALEEPRVNTWVRQRYPGSVPWFGRLAEDARQPVTETLPDFARFCLECSREELLGWTTSSPMPERVARALEQTRAARREYAETLPPPDLDPGPLGAGLPIRYREEVWPHLADRSHNELPAPWEQAVRLSAWQALGVAVRDIFPIAAALLEGDVEHIGRRLWGAIDLRQEARSALDEGNPASVNRVIQRSLGSDASPGDGSMPAGPRELAMDLLEESLSCQQTTCSPAMGRGRLIDRGQPSCPAAAMHREGPPGSMPGRPRPGALPELRPVRLPPAPPGYDQALERVAHQIDHLVTQLESVLRPRRRLGEKTGYPSGHKLDLRRVMAWEADPRTYDKLWRRKSIPHRRDTAFLLVDLSGSMHGEKTETALAGTVLMAETLHRLGVPFAVLGFQDVIIPFCDFPGGLTPDVRRALGEMPQEVEARRPNGNNQPGHNDDGPCLLEAAETLLGWSASQRVLVAVSDGLPAGRHSTEEDLRNAVASLREHGPALKLVGIGLGPGTDHVREYYPESIASVPLESFAAQIGELLRRTLVGEGAADADMLER